MSTATNTVRWSPITDYLIGILRNLQGSRPLPRARNETAENPLLYWPESELEVTHEQRST